MANQWFKFYGMDYLNSATMARLTAAERSCWITLMCYASMKDNKIEFLDEDTLLDKSGVCNEEQRNATKGVLDKFVKFKMIQVDVDQITLNNFEKRQEYTMTSTERSQKFREKQRVSLDMQRNATQSNANATLEENRIEENRIDKNIKGMSVPYSEVFEKFWLAYPEKIGKGKAYDSWKKLTLETQEICIDVIQKQTLANHFRGKDGVDYIPHPTTWLNQKRWEDEVKVKVDINKPKYIDLTKK